MLVSLPLRWGDNSWNSGLRQSHDESRMVILAIKLQRALVNVYNGPRQGKTQTSAIARTLGSEEGLKNLVLNLFRDLRA